MSGELSGIEEIREQCGKLRKLLPAQAAKHFDDTGESATSGNCDEGRRDRVLPSTNIALWNDFLSA